MTSARPNGLPVFTQIKNSPLYIENKGRFFYLFLAVIVFFAEGVFNIVNVLDSNIQ